MKNVAVTAFLIAAVVFGLSSPAHSAAGRWVLTGQQVLNPASLGKKCFYRWSTDVNRKLTITVSPYTLCPINY